MTAATPRTAAYLRAYSLFEAVQGEEHADAAAALPDLEAHAESHGWPEVAFVASAATAVMTAQNVSAQGLQRSVEASERELTASTRARAACSVSNTRNSYGYCCVLRLAAHPDPQRSRTAVLPPRHETRLWPC